MSSPRQGVPLLVIIVSLALLMLAIYTFNQGINLFFSSEGDVTTALVYLSVTIVSFGLVAMTVLRIRRGYSLGSLTPKVLSVVRCAQCSFKQIKSFAMGDYVFKAQGRCAQCGNESLFINGIYAEDLRKHPSNVVG